MRKRIVIIILCIGFLILFLSLFNYGKKRAHITLPKAHNGVLDLNHWNFDNKMFIELNGEWEFFENQLLEPDDFVSMKTEKYQTIDDYFEPEKFGTYRLKIILPEKMIVTLIPHSNSYSRYRLWIDNRFLFQLGDFDREREINATRGRKSFSHQSNDTEIYITLQVIQECGKIIIDSQKNVIDYYSHQGNMLSAVLSLLFVMALYHFCLFLFRPQDRSTLYFGLFCLSILILQATSNYENGLADRGINILIYWLINHWGNYIWHNTWNSSAIVCLITFYLFVKELFTDKVSKKMNRIFYSIIIIISIITVINNFVFFDIITLFNILVVILGLICIYIVVKSVKSKLKNSNLVLIGTVVIFIFSCIDVLTSEDIIDVPKMTGYGVSIFVVIQSIVIARRFSQSFRNVEILSERLKVLDRLKDEFLANTSHELRTPINGIIGISESLIDGATGKLANETIDNLAMIVASGKRLANLINDILDYSRLKNNDISLNYKKVDIRELVGVVMTIVRSISSKKDITFINDISPEIPLIYGDENRIEQMMFNLIGNAFKFTDKGYIKTSARDIGSFIEICIEDTGIGIEEKNLTRIFQSFEQIDGSTTRSFTGTGLGLNITKNLVELHGGLIRVTSEKLVGSKFFVTLPKYDGNDYRDNKTTNEVFDNHPITLNLYEVDKLLPFDKNTMNDNSDIKILVVDDEKINVQVLVNQLSIYKYQVETASNGIEALDKVKSKDYDLILLDIMMPKMSGYEVCKIIRENKSIYEIPIILLTAKNQPRDIVVGFDVGANDYLVKPFIKNELIARVKTLVSLKRSVKEAINNAVLANIDSLTGLFNRRYFFLLAEKEFAASQRYKRDLSVIMMDIDHFKSINDTYGHDVGDEVLKGVSKVIRGSLRESDISCRYGGEEFALILRETNLSGSLSLCERIRKKIEHWTFENSKKQIITCTISMGITVYHDEESITELLKKADIMLYNAKKKGRNRVEYRY